MGHPTATAAHFPAEGKTLLSASYQDIREWDLETKSLVRRYHCEGVYARELTTSSDGRHIVVRDWDSVFVINRLDGRLVHKVRAEDVDDRIESCAVSHDGQLLATGTFAGSLRICHLATGEQLPFRVSHPIIKIVQKPPMLVQQPKRPPRITHIAFTPDSRTVASSADADVIRAWDVATAKEVWALDPRLSRSGPMAFSPDGKHLLAPKLVPEEKKNERPLKGARGVGGYALWSVADRSLALELDGEVWPYRVAFSPDGRFIAEGSGRFSVKNASTGAERFNAPVGGNAVSSLEFSRDGKFVACVASGLGLWEVGTGREILGVNGHIGPVTSAAVSNDWRWIVTGGTEGTVRLWDAASGKHLLTCVHGGQLSGVAFSPDSALIASAASDGTVRLWSIATGAEVRRLEFPPDQLGDVAFSPDGKLLGVGSRNLTVHLFDAATGMKKSELVGYDGFSQNGGSMFRFLPDGKHIAALIRRGAGCVGDPLRENYPSPAVLSPFDPKLGPAGETDGKWRLALWEIASGKRAKLLGPAAEHGLWFTISRDGERVALSNYESPVSVIGIKSGEIERQFEAKNGNCLHFTATGDLFVGSICYDLDAGGELKRLAAIPHDRLPLAVFPDGHRVVAWGPEAPMVWTVFGP